MYNNRAGESLHNLTKEDGNITSNLNLIKSDIETLKNFKENSILSFKDLSNDLYKKYNININKIFNKEKYIKHINF